jgi:type IV pilus biogenesis protein CpaD/CtpE
MTINRTPLALGLAATLLLGACAPVTSYTDAEAPRNLTTDSSTTRVDLHFAPGSAQLSPADAAKLRHLAAAGSIGAADRVTVASSGPPYLSSSRGSVRSPPRCCPTGSSSAAPSSPTRRSTTRLSRSRGAW